MRGSIHGAARVMVLVVALVIGVPSSDGGADISWIPLKRITETEVVLVSGAAELADVRGALASSARQVLRDRGYYGASEPWESLYVYVTVLECGDDCADSLIVAVAVTFEDMVAVRTGDDSPPENYQVGTWRHDDLALVQRERLADDVGRMIVDGVRRFADSLDKVSEFRKRSG